MNAVVLTPTHPIEQIDIANEHRIRGHPCIRSQGWDAVAQGYQLTLPARAAYNKLVAMAVG